MPENYNKLAILSCHSVFITMNRRASQVVENVLRKHNIPVGESTNTIYHLSGLSTQLSRNSRKMKPRGSRGPLRKIGVSGHFEAKYGLF